MFQWGKSSLFNWDNWVTTCKRMKLDPYLILSTKVKLKWIRDLNERAKTHCLDVIDET